MTIETFATLFAGGGGADCGLSQAGLDHLWGVEKEVKYANISALNGFEPMVGDVCEVDWSGLAAPDWLHASPPCQNASVANHRQGEGDSDVELASAVVNAVRSLKPKVFSLENVQGYLGFNSFWAIEQSLCDLGYLVVWHTLNAANYGVPQTRKRLFLVARRKELGYPDMPMPTHLSDVSQGNLLQPDQKKWRGWGDVIKPCDVPDAEMSDRMIEALPSELNDWQLATGFKNSGGQINRPLTLRRSGQPAPTLLASMDRPTLMPWLVSRNEQGDVLAKCLDVPQMATLQGFPSGYQFGDNLPAARQTIGNSVCPAVMRAIALANI